MTYSSAHDPPSWPDLVLSHGDVHRELESLGWVHKDCSTGGGASTGGWVGIRLRAEGQSRGFSQMLRMWRREPAACFTSWQFTHRYSSLPVFQPQTQHTVDILPHMYHVAQTCGFPDGSDRKEPTMQCRRPGLDPWEASLSGLHVISTQARNRKTYSQKPLTVSFLESSVLPLGHPLRGAWEHLCPTSWCCPWLFLHSGLGHLMKRTTYSSVVHSWVSLIYLVLKHKSLDPGTAL